jgi:hypothetical protein
MMTLALFHHLPHATDPSWDVYALVVGGRFIAILENDEWAFRGRYTEQLIELPSGEVVECYSYGYQHGGIDLGYDIDVAARRRALGVVEKRPKRAKQQPPTTSSTPAVAPQLGLDLTAA